MDWVDTKDFSEKFNFNITYKGNNIGRWEDEEITNGAVKSVHASVLSKDGFLRISCGNFQRDFKRWSTNINFAFSTKK